MTQVQSQPSRPLSIIDHKVILLHDPEPQVLEHLHQYKVRCIPTGYRNEHVCKWTLDAVGILSLCGVPCPSPVFFDYDFPHPPTWTVFQHQYRIVDFAVRHKRGFILAGMGSGKTACALWATDYLRRKGIIKSVLIICPLSVMNDAWMKTVPQLFHDHRSILAIHGSRKERNLNTVADYHVINFDGLKRLMPQLLQQQWDVVIVDESVMIKNAKTARSRACKTLIDRAHYAWLMTGRPTPQSPLDAHGQLYALSRYRHGLRHWQELTQIKVSEYKWINKQGWQDTVHHMMRPAIQVDTRDCIDLPPLNYVPMHVPLTKAQAEATTILKNDQAMLVDETEILAPNAGVLRTKLLQIACGAVRAGDENVIEFKPTGRLEVVEQVINQAQSKVIVYAPFKAVVHMIANTLRSAGFKVGMVTGEVGASRRQEVFDSIQSNADDALQVLVAVPQAMSHGVTLTNADMIVWFSPIDSNDAYRQAIARMERQGQKRRMTVVCISGSSIEAKMYDVLRSRDTEQNQLLNLFS